MNLQLTLKQVNSFESELFGKKHWSEKKEHCIRQFNSRLQSFSSERVNDSNIEWFIETFLPNERKRIDKEIFQKMQSGELQGKFTPTDKATDAFDMVDHPEINKKYHVSWGFKGAVFVLKKIDGIYGYVDNPKHKRKNLLRIQLCDLRELRKNKK